MELSIEQALQQAIAAHKKGKLQEAERLYRAILQSQPTHPDANHNLGLIAVSVNQPVAALTHFKTAISGNPNSEQFWESYTAAVIKGYENGFARTIPEKLTDNQITAKKINSIENTSNGDSSTVLFESPRPMEYETFYRPGMGTENVGGFLRAMALMRRPSRILEIGAGYTTPFLLEALVNSKRVYDDGNLREPYFKNYTYNPKLVVVDNMSLGELSLKPGMKAIISSNYVEFVQGNFEEKADILSEKYGTFDFVWFDCGGVLEYKSFLNKYWKICSGYVFFHYTYTNGSPNEIHKTILDNVTGKPFIFDIVEPHKKKQGSITMVKKRDCV